MRSGSNEPVTMSKIRMCLSSCPVISSGIVGCDTMLFVCAEIESSAPVSLGHRSLCHIEQTGNSPPSTGSIWNFDSSFPVSMSKILITAF